MKPGAELSPDLTPSGSDMPQSPDRGFGLYVHWPFCQSKCPYCDFNSHVAGRIDQERWLRAYLAEIDRAGMETKDQVLQSVFFGGGTPSLMNPETVAQIIAKVRATWRMSNDPEITLEANPTSVEAGRFSAYAAAGVNRVSIGVQALHDDALRQLGRLHSAQEAIRAVEIARSIFDRTNFDLIYARQGQDMAAWRQELQQALALQPTHLSLYQLTIEEGTVFHDRHARGQLRGLPDEDTSADMFLMTQDVCADAGLPAYEVSNHALPGQESRHNTTYWRGGEYVGIGPGAHGRLRAGGVRIATEAIRDPMAWLTAVEAVGTGELPRAPLAGKEAASEYLLMGLRMYEGVHLAHLGSLFAGELDHGAVQFLVDQDLIDVGNGRIRVTKTGMPLLNQVLKELVQSWN